MGLNELSEMIKDSLDGIRGVLEHETLTPEPMIMEDGSVILPINKLTVGFLTAGGETGKKFKPKGEDLPLGGIGGGLTLSPMGFFIYKDGISNLINIQGDGSDKWLDLVYSIIRQVSKE